MGGVGDGVYLSRNYRLIVAQRDFDVLKTNLLYGKVNPSVLISSSLVRITPYGPFPCIFFLFVFKSRQIKKKYGPSAIHTINYLLT